MSRIAKINVAGIRKSLTKVPKTAEFKPALQVLKKQLTKYEKYERDGDEPEAMEKLKGLIVDGAERLKARVEHRNKIKA